MPKINDQRPLLWLIPAALAAASLPSLLAYNTAPSATFLNQALALLCWGLMAAATGLELQLTDAQRQRLWRASLLPLLPLLIPLLAAAIGGLWGHLPAPLALSGVGTLAAAGLLVLAGCRSASSDAEAVSRVFAVFCWAWLVSGLVNASIAAIQVFAPHWTDGNWLARSALPGRAVGNLRQPNHLCTLLLWAAIAALALYELKRLSRSALGISLAVLSLALVLTASRTAVVGVALLALWGLTDRRLSRQGRAWLIGMPALYALAWLAMRARSQLTQAAFGGEARLAEADLSASRFRIWSDTWALIQQHPLSGVGFGEFNKAWTLTPMPDRPPAFFDHSHNLLLQWAAEFGLPVAIILTSLLCLLLFRIWQAGRASADWPQAHLPVRACLAFLLMMALHSQLEYPLWYAYFLLPTAWLLGFGWTCAQRSQEPAGSADGHAQRRGSPGLAAAGVALALASVLAVVDYSRVAVIFDSTSPVPLAQRITSGQRSVLFAHHADYAAATVSPQPERELAALARASHYLLDTRLMTAWADGWAAAGDMPRAIHLAARLREFRNPASSEYFAVCAAAGKLPAGETRPNLPYQCRPEPAAPARRWTDF